MNHIYHLGDDLWKLIQADIDGNLDLNETRELENAILSDDETLHTYIKCVKLHSDLYLWAREASAYSQCVTAISGAQDLKASGSTEPPTPSTSARSASILQHARRGPIGTSIAVAALVVALIITTMAVVGPPFYQPVTDNAERSHSVAIAGRVTQVHEVEWAEGSDAKVGAYLSPGRRLELVAGLAEVTYDSGARVILQAPCDFTVASGTSGALRHGKLTAHIDGENKNGFVVHAPFAQVTDLGTAFAIAARKTETAVQCLQGRIAIDYARDNARRLELVAGQRLLLGEDGSVQFNPSAGGFPNFVSNMPQQENGSFRTTPWLDNDESPLADDMEYTHLVDFTGHGDAASYQGVRFSACTLPKGPLADASVSGRDNASGCRWSVAGYTQVMHESPRFRAVGFADDSRQRALLDVSLARIDQPRGHSNITLHDLTPGREYELILFSAPWSGPEPHRIALLSGSEGGALEWDQQRSAGLIRYRYTASGSTVQMRIAHHTLPEASWHLYAFANAELDRPSPIEAPPSE